MKKNLKYLILPSIQGLGATIIFFCEISLPDEMIIYEAGIFLISLIMGFLLLRLGIILISSYIINLTKFIIYKIRKENIISLCFYPIFVYEGKKTISNIFWVYDDRTCFSMNKYVKDKVSFEKLRKFILVRNRVSAGIYTTCIVGITLFCVACHWFAVGWTILLGAMEHFYYQYEYKTIEAANAMAFAGLKRVDNRLLLHILVNQSKLESLDIGGEVAEILAKDMYDRDGGYFFNYLCLSGMFYEVSEGLEQEFSLRKYMDQKVDNIIDCSDSAMSSVKYRENQLMYQNIDRKICLFFDNYREFLLYVLMYYELKEEKIRYQRLKNYMEYMLREVDKKCVHDSVLSESVLSNKFYEYQDLFYQVLEKTFIPEKSIFTGYETLPIWKTQREKFIEVYNADEDTGVADIFMPKEKEM